MERLCLNCGKVVHGRADKKFCGDPCRSMYNFAHNNSSTNIVRNINNILKKNRKILMELNPHGKVTIFKNELSERGFNFDYFTNTYETSEKKIYHYCYDMGYLEINDKKVLLVIKGNFPKYASTKKYAGQALQTAYLNDNEA